MVRRRPARASRMASPFAHHGGACTVCADTVPLNAWTDGGSDRGPPWLESKRIDASCRRGRGPAASSLWADRHFKWLLVAPAALLILALSIYPLLFSIWVAFVNYDFQIPGHAFVGLQNFEQVIDDPVARCVAADDRAPVGRQRRDRVPARPRPRPGHDEDVPRPRRDHADPDRAAVHQPGDRRPGLVADPAAAVRAHRLSASASCSGRRDISWLTGNPGTSSR